MPTLEATLLLKLDGVDVPNTPLVTRLTVNETETFDVTRSSTGTYVAIGGLPTIQVLLFRPLDEAVVLRLDGQTDAGIPLAAGGWVFVFNADIDAGVASNLKLNNNSGAPTQVVGVLGGAE